MGSIQVVGGNYKKHPSYQLPKNRLLYLSINLKLK